MGRTMKPHHLEPFLVLAGLIVFFGVAWLVGALDKDLIGQLKRRRPPKQAVDLAE